MAKRQSIAMTPSLKEAIDALRRLPEDIPDRVARALIMQIHEEPELDSEFDAELQLRLPRR
jgi:hypothetical protein